MHYCSSGGHFGFSQNHNFSILGAPSACPILGRIPKKCIKTCVGHPFEKMVNNNVTYLSKPLSKLRFSEGGAY